MASSTGMSQFSLRPWPIGDKKPKNLTEFVTRISIERGGFRNVPTEAEIREEAEIQAQRVTQMDHDGVDGSSESEDDVDASKIKSAWSSQREFLMNLDYAHNHTLLALEFVSLLLSKENPSQAGATLSPELRDMVGIGTLGASKLKESNMTAARIDDDVAVVTGWRVMGVNMMVNSVLEAAERLEKEMALETTYWADILAIKEDGHDICHLPNERFTLGVRYGLTESAPIFYNNCIAPLRRNDDGTARLDTGPIGGGSQRVSVTIQTNGKVTGLSRLRRRLNDDAPIQLRVREARKTAFSQELWHELHREARMLLALGVRSDQHSVTWDLGPGTKVIFTLEDLTDRESPEIRHTHDWLAEAVSRSLLSLLFNAHEQNYKRRTRPQPPAPDRTNPNPVYAILRPLITQAKHMNAVMGLMSFFEQLVNLLHRAGVTVASYTKPHISGFRGPPAQAHHATLHESLASQMFYTMELFVELTMTPEARVQIRGATYLAPYVGHRFSVVLPSSGVQPGGAQNQHGQNGTGANASDSGNGNVPNSNNQEQQNLQNQNQNQQQPPSLLESAYPPASDPYHNHVSVMEYLRNAAVRALAAHLAAASQRRFADAMRDDGTGTGAVTWAETMRGPAVLADGYPEREVFVNLCYEEDHHQRTRRLVLRLDARWHGRGGGARTGSWCWTAHEQQHGDGGVGDKESPEDVVFGVLAGEM